MGAISSARQVGGVVRAERKRYGWTQAVLAERSGVSRAWLVRFETGYPAASLEQVFRVLAALDLDLNLTARRVSPPEAEVLAAIAARDQR